MLLRAQKANLRPALAPVDLLVLVVAPDRVVQPEAVDFVGLMDGESGEREDVYCCCEERPEEEWDMECDGCGGGRLRVEVLNMPCGGGRRERGDVALPLDGGTSEDVLRRERYDGRGPLLSFAKTSSIPPGPLPLSYALLLLIAFVLRFRPKNPRPRRSFWGSPAYARPRPFGDEGPGPGMKETYSAVGDA